jgi:hypothetical protein
MAHGPRHPADVFLLEPAFKATYKESKANAYSWPRQQDKKNVTDKMIKMFQDAFDRHSCSVNVSKCIYQGTREPNLSVFPDQLK